MKSNVNVIWVYSIDSNERLYYAGVLLVADGVPGGQISKVSLFEMKTGCTFLRLTISAYKVSLYSWIVYLVLSLMGMVIIRPHSGSSAGLWNWDR